MVGRHVGRFSGTASSGPAAHNRYSSARGRAIVTIAATLVVAMIFPMKALAIDNPLAFDLYSHRGALVEASATIFQSGTTVLVNLVGKRQIPKRAAVTLNAGDCTAPGSIAFALSRFRTNQSLTELKHPTSEILKRAKSMVIHVAPSETSEVLACGTLRG
jgi:hypothetical protein